MVTSNYFTELNSINVQDKIEKKNGLSYLSWCYAWGELKKRHPEATYTIYENCNGLNYHTDGNTAWVKTGVTVNGIEHIEYLPVMDYKNKSIPVANITSFDVNKAIQRSLTKAVARHGLGLYVYAGEDLPEANNTTTAERTAITVQEAPKDEPFLTEEDQVMLLEDSIDECATEEQLKDVYLRYKEQIMKDKTNKLLDRVTKKRKELKGAA